jgi:hypothetical protein
MRLFMLFRKLLRYVFPFASYVTLEFNVILFAPDRALTYSMDSLTPKPPSASTVRHSSPSQEMRVSGPVSGAGLSFGSFVFFQRVYALAAAYVLNWPRRTF